MANFVGGGLKTPRPVACTHPEFVVVGRETYAVKTRFSPPCKPETPGQAGRGLEVEKALLFPVVDQRNLSSAGIIMGGGEKSNREFLSLKQGNSTGNSAQMGGAGLLRWGASAGGARGQDKRGAREQGKSGARNVQPSGGCAGTSKTHTKGTTLSNVYNKICRLQIFTFASVGF